MSRALWTQGIVLVAPSLHIYAYSTSCHRMVWKLTQHRKPARDSAGAQDVHLHPLHALIPFLKEKSVLHVATSSVLKPPTTVIHGPYNLHGHKAPLVSEFPGYLLVFHFSSLLLKWSTVPSFSKLSSIFLSWFWSYCSPSVLLSCGWPRLSLLPVLTSPVSPSQDSSLSSLTFSFHTSSHYMLVTPNVYQLPVFLLTRSSYLIVRDIPTWTSKRHFNPLSLNVTTSHPTCDTCTQITSLTTVTIFWKWQRFHLQRQKIGICPWLFHS